MADNTRSPRSDDDLRAASEHLHYEVSMLIGTAQILALGVIGPGVLHNALVEAFVIHLRVVLEFLHPSGAKRDDVIAHDFFEDPNVWRRARPLMSDALAKARDRAGAEMAHLTYARLKVTPEAKPWKFGELTHEVTEIFKAFLQCAPKDRLNSRFHVPPSA